MFNWIKENWEVISLVVGSVIFIVPVWLSINNIIQGQGDIINRLDYLFGRDMEFQNQWSKEDDISRQRLQDLLYELSQGQSDIKDVINRIESSQDDTSIHISEINSNTGQILGILIGSSNFECKASAN